MVPVTSFFLLQLNIAIVLIPALCRIAFKRITSRQRLPVHNDSRLICCVVIFMILVQHRKQHYSPILLGCIGITKFSYIMSEYGRYRPCNHIFFLCSGEILGVFCLKIHTTLNGLVICSYVACNLSFALVLLLRSNIKQQNTNHKYKLTTFREGSRHSFPCSIFFGFHVLHESSSFFVLSSKYCCTRNINICSRFNDTFLALQKTAKELSL